MDLVRGKEDYVSFVTRNATGNIMNAIVEEDYIEKSMSFSSITQMEELHLSLVVATEEDYKSLRKVYKQVSELIEDPIVLPYHTQEKLQSIHDSLYAILHGSKSQE